MNDNLEEIYKRNLDTVYRICFLMMKNKADAEDCTADTFVLLIRKKISFENEEHEKAWLIRAASNICRNALKRRRYKKDSLTDDIAVTEKFTDDILSAVLSLPEKYRCVIYLYYYEGYSCAEIAKMTDSIKSTVESRMQRGRKLLKGALCDDESE